MGASKKSKATPNQDSGIIRVDPKLNIPVRHQIRWAKMKKDYAAKEQKCYRKEKTKFRRNKDEEPEYVEEIDLSKVDMTHVMPTLLVDGYNIIMYWSKLKKRMETGETDRARGMLLDELAELSAMRGWDIKIVFDAYMTKSSHSTFTKIGKRLETIFTSDQTADEYIEMETQMLKQSGCPSVMVATGDSVIRSIASSNGALILSPSKIIQEIKMARRESIAIATGKISSNTGGSAPGVGIMSSMRVLNNLDEDTQRKLLRLRVGLSAEETEEEKLNRLSTLQ